jgi:hypothetical protein
VALERHLAEWTYDPDTGLTRVSLHGTVLPGDAALMVTVSSVIGFHLDSDGKVIGLDFHGDHGQIASFARSVEEEEDEL